MKLKTKIALVLLSVLPGICNAQTGARSASDLRSLIVERFINEFRPDYALFSHSGARLIRKGDQWSSIMLWDMHYPFNPKEARGIDVTEQVISANRAEKILAESAADSLFSIGQERFDALPKTCEGEPGMKRGIYGLYDGGTAVVWEFTRETKRMIQFYGAESYYRTCCPYQPEYKILGTLLKTLKVLRKNAPMRTS